MSGTLPFDLARTCIHLTDGADATAVAVTEDFWASLAGRSELHDGRLVTLTAQAVSWQSWEMHPAGDEIVCLLSGAVDLILDAPGAERVVALRGQSACIVPRGVWHRAVVHVPGDMLFITRGAGTEHRPLEPRSVT